MHLPLSVDNTTVPGRPAYIRNVNGSIIALVCNFADAEALVKAVNQTTIPNPNYVSPAKLDTTKQAE